MARISKQELITLQKKLKTDAKICAKFGVTRQAVYQLRKKYGIPAIMGKNKERNAKILELRKQGETCYAIAKKINVSIFVIYSIISQSKKSKAKK